MRQPNLPPKIAPGDQMHAIDRQNEAAVALADYGEDVERLSNTMKIVENFGLKINGQIADFFSPISRSPFSVLMSIRGKVEKQAPTIVVNLQDSVITISQLEGALRANPVPGLRAVDSMKTGKSP